MPECFFTTLDLDVGDCHMRPDGNFDRVHLIPKQRIARERPELDVWNERLWVPGCRGHHHRFDNGFITLSLEHYPPKLLAWAQQHGFYFTERGWRAEHRDQEAAA